MTGRRWEIFDPYSGRTVGLVRWRWLARLVTRLARTLDYDQAESVSAGVRARAAVVLRNRTPALGHVQHRYLGIARWRDDSPRADCGKCGEPARVRCDVMMKAQGRVKVFYACRAHEAELDAYLANANGHDARQTGQTEGRSFEACDAELSRRN